MTSRLPFLLAVLAVLAAGPASAENEATALRAWGVPSGAVQGPNGESQLRIMEAFKARHPGLERLEPATGLVIPGRSMDTQPLMQIAGDVSPDVIYVNFRQSDTYIRNKFLYPLDAYIEKVAGAEMPPDACTLDNDAYYARLSQGTAFDREIRERMPRILWDVVRRECPYGAECPYGHLHGGGDAAEKPPHPAPHEVISHGGEEGPQEHGSLLADVQNARLQGPAPPQGRQDQGGHHADGGAKQFDHG